MIVNAFLFMNEFDLLDVRLAELSGVVDRFVLVEAPMTFSGRPKPLHFDSRKHLYADFPIVNVVANDLHLYSDAWRREYRSRDFLWYGLQDTAPDDWIIVTDADEIPRRSAVQQLAGLQCDTVRFKADMYYYSMTHKLRGVDWSFPAVKRRSWRGGAEAHGRREGVHYIDNGGWHFSYLGDVWAIREKLESFSHTEYNTDYWKNPARIQAMIDSNQELFERSQFPIHRVPVTAESHPAYVVDNERFAQWC